MKTQYVLDSHKFYTLNDVSKFIAHELDKIQQCPSFSTWYLEIKFHLHLPTYESFEKTTKIIKATQGEESAKKLKEKEKKIMGMFGLSWAYAFGLGKEHSYDIHNEYQIGSSEYTLILKKFQEMDVENLIERSRIIPNLERHLGTKDFTDQIKKELPSFLEELLPSRWYYYDDASDTKEFIFPIDKDAPEIIQRKNREFIKQNEVKLKILNDPQAMIQFYESTKASNSPF